MKHLSGHQTLETQHSALRSEFDAVQAERVAMETENLDLKKIRQLLQADLEKSKQSKCSASYHRSWIVLIWNDLWTCHVSKCKRVI